MKKKYNIQAALLATIMTAAIITGCGASAAGANAPANNNSTAGTSSDATSAGKSGADVSAKDNSGTTATATVQNSGSAASNSGASTSTTATASSSNLSEEELAEIEEDFMHMENNFFLCQEFSDEDDIDWEAIYKRRTQDTFEPDQYKCVSGGKLGYTYRVRLELVGIPKNEEKAAHSSYNDDPDRIVVFEKKGSKYTFRKNEFLWSENCDDTFDVYLRPLGQCKFVVFYDSRYKECADIVVLSGNKKVASVTGAYFSKIDNIYPVDYDANGFDDIVITGDHGSKKNLGFMEFNAGWDSDTPYFFEECPNTSEDAKKKLGDDYSLDRIKEYVLLNDIKDVEFWGEEYTHSYDSYKEAYYALASKVEAEEDMNESREPQKASCRYELKKLDNDGIPEFLVKDSEGKVNIYTFKDDELRVYEEEGAASETGEDSTDTKDSFPEADSFTIKDSFPVIQKKLGYSADKVTLLYDKKENDKNKKKSDKPKAVRDVANDFNTIINFSVGYKEYSFGIKDDSWGHIKLGLMDKENLVETQTEFSVSKVFLVEKADGHAFLVMFNMNRWYHGTAFVYNLNGNKVTAPKEFNGDYIYCLTDIKDSSNFELMSISELIGSTLTKKTFYMDPCGEIKSTDDYGYYIKGTSICDGEPIAKSGDVMTAKKDLEPEASKTPEDPDSMEDITLPKGTKVTFYRIKDRDVYLLIPDGRQICFHMLGEDEDPGDEPVNHIDEMFEDLPYIPEPEVEW